MQVRYLNINEYDRIIRKSEIDKLNALLEEEGFVRLQDPVFTNALETAVIYENKNGGSLIARFAMGAYPYRDKEFEVSQVPWDSKTGEFRKDVKQQEYTPSQVGYNCEFRFISISEDKIKDFDLKAKQILPHWHLRGE